MKITKKYALSEETLEKDIDAFIRNAKDGQYHYDYKYGMEGLRTIKAYFRMIKDEFKKQNYTECQACYKKILFFLLQTEENYFDYEDIVGKLKFEEYVANYFTCMIKIFSVEELFREYMEFLKAKEDYDFVSLHKTILLNLPEEKLAEFKILAEKEAENIKEKDYAFYDVVYFLLDLAKLKKDRNQYDMLCDKYAHIVDDWQKEEFDAED